MAHTTRRGRVGRGLLSAAFVLGAGLGPTASASVITLSPFGTTGANPGIHQHWVQVTPTWQGPSYDPSSSSATALDGISSLADANAALSLTAGDAGFVAGVSGVYVGPINYANTYFNTDPNSQPQYGTGTLPPLFNGSTPASSQIDYAGHLSGYLDVPTAGSYNFGVLADDGFSFTLSGAGGHSESMSLDGLNPRTYTYFGQNLDLAAGLYKYDLVGYNRLQNGVVRLLMGSATGAWNPTIVPGQQFYTGVAPVPLPGAAWLMSSGLVGLTAVGGLKRRKKNLA